jgi:signal transduction histidine kinase
MPRADLIMASTATMLAVFAVLFVIGFVILNRTQEQTIAQVTVTREAGVAANGLMQASIDAESGQRSYLLTDDEVFLATYERSKANAAAELHNLHTIAQRAPAILPDLAKTEDDVGVAFAAIDHTLALHEHRTLPRVQLRDELVRSKTTMDQARNSANALLRHVERIIDAARSRNASGRVGIYVLGGLLGLLTILAIAICFWALRAERRAWSAALAASQEAKTAAEISRAKAAASDLAKTRFLAVASHDMRQPLHALTLYLSALSRRVDGAEAKDIVAKMDRAANSLVGMFASLLDLARIQADVIRPEIEEFPLQEIIDRVVAEYPDATVIGPVPPTPLMVRSDPVLLERLLRNLVSNAIRHGGGAATISVSPTGQRARIAISDSGPGIDEDDHERIFAEFERLEARGGVEGLGLGLAIVKRIAELLDLRLELHSARGAGATFSVEPALARGVKSIPHSPARERRFDGVRISILDDDPLALEAVAGVLRDTGASVRTFETAAALESAVREKPGPDLLVMDLRLDGQLRGVDVANRIRAELTPPPAVIIITGDTAADTLGFLRSSGYSWLIKPVDRAALTTAIANLLQNSFSLT